MTTSTSTTGTVSSTSSGTSYITGSATGLNVTALIQAAVAAKSVPKTRIDTQISANVNKISAYQALQTNAAALKTASDALKSDTLLGNTFTSKQLSYSTSDGSTASGILSATTSTGAQAGTYKVVVSQLAQAQTVTSSVQTTQTTALGYTGSFTLGEDGKTGVAINVTPTMTLQSLRNAINTQTSTSGVSADILQLGNGQYKLILSSVDTNKEINVTGVTGDDVLQNLGVTNSSQAFVNETKQAKPALLTINDEPVTSDSNQLNNVLTGINLNLVSAAPGTTVTVTAGNNTDGAMTAIQAFVTAYNTLAATVKQLKEINSDGTVADTAYLYGESTNSTLGSQAASLLSSTYGDANSALNGLRSIGVTINSSDELEVNTVTLATALQTNYSGVADIFASTTNSVGLADQMSTLVDSYSNIVSGQIAKQIANLQSVDIDLQSKSDAMQDTIDAYQSQLINTYANLEALYKQADTTKKQILAILDGSSNNN